MSVPKLLAQDRTGGVALEFAFVAPLLIALTLGIFDLGRLGFTLSSLKYAASEAARYASVHGGESPSPASDATVKSFVRGKAIGIPGSDLQISIIWSPNSNRGSNVTVQIQYDFRFFASALLPIGPMSLRESSTFVVF